MVRPVAAGARAAYWRRQDVPSPELRHSSFELTINVYTDPTLPDVAGAVDALPELRPAAVARSGKTLAT